MYIIELTDTKILIFNKRKRVLIIENIPSNIIVNNKIYDFIKLERIIKSIFSKNNLLNSLFKIKVNILIFEKLTPSETYLVKKIFDNISDINLEIIHPYTLFENNYLFVSGNKLYYKDKQISKIPKGIYYLVGYSNDYERIMEKLEKEYNIEVYKYENSDYYIYEKIFY